MYMRCFVSFVVHPALGLLNIIIGTQVYRIFLEKIVRKFSLLIYLLTLYVRSFYIESRKNNIVCKATNCRLTA